MSRQQQFNYSQDDESQDSLADQMYRRQNQLKLQDYLSDDIREGPEMRNANKGFKSNYNNHAGLSANELHRPSSKQSHQQMPTIEEKSHNSSHQSTVTATNQCIKLKDTKINNQIQKNLLKDIQDQGKGKDCGGCKPKPPGGLSYKERNKKLIKQHEDRVYSKKEEEKQDNFHTPEKKQVLKNQNVDFKQGLNEFQFSENQNEIPENFISEKREHPSLDPSKKFNFIIEKSKVQKQKRLNISGHTVFFPYQPYDAQINYMEKVIQSIDKRQNAILESPTGTGKTLCLLSAALSWVQSEYWKSYKQVSIVYLSRTHSQLAQVSKELEKTCFRPTIATFGSRDNFCIKQNFKELKGRQKVEACSKGVKLFLRYGKEQKRHIDLKFDQTDEQRHSRMGLPTSQKKLSDMPPKDQQQIQQTMCTYYKGQRFVLELARNQFKNKIISNQKIKKLGQKHRFCPYYYPHFVKPICNLFLMPYNYLLDSQLNSKYKSIIKDSILIFDEAHNVTESSCEGRSFSINKRTFEDAIKQLKKFIKGQKQSQQLYAVRNQFDSQLCTVEQQIQRIFQRINNFVGEIEFVSNQNVSEDDAGEKKMFTIHETQQKIYEFLYDKVNDQEHKIFLNLPNDKAQRDLIKKMAKQIENNFSMIVQLCEALSQTPDGIYQNIQKVAGFVNKCISLILQSPDDYKWIDRQINHHRVMVKKVDKNWEINLVCLVPFLTMKNIALMEPRNIILTSGTLSPIQTWDNELGIPFPIRFTNNHVISPNQLMLRILTGQEKQSFNYSFKYLQENFKTIYQLTLRSIIRLAEKIPNGMLVVTPSYKVMNSIERCMQYNPDLKKRLYSVKKVFMESKDNFEDLIQKYRKAAVQQKGALLFCVCRGKISEGIDFPNELCRSVIFVGIPFPNVMDMTISQKKSHYDRIGQNEVTYKFSGNKWYENLTFRSVNQAIGRVIRHINDYGSIFLMDVRYNMQGYKSQLPKWSQNSLKTIQLKPQVYDELQNFYEDMEIRFGNYEGKPNREKSQESANETDYFFDEEKPKFVKNEKPSQNNFQKIQGKKSFPSQYYNKPKQAQKKVQKDAFSAIMGTKQNKFSKKKSSLVFDPNKKA